MSELVGMVGMSHSPFATMMPPTVTDAPGGRFLADAARVARAVSTLAPDALVVIGPRMDTTRDEVAVAPVASVTTTATSIAQNATTVIAALVLAVLVPSVISVAVAVQLPAVFKVTLKVRVPATSAALAGKVALASLEVMPTVWVLLTKFQLASTALTVTVNGVPAV